MEAKRQGAGDVVIGIDVFGLTSIVTLHILRSSFADAALIFLWKCAIMTCICRDVAAITAAFPQNRDKERSVHYGSKAAGRRRRCHWH